MRLEKNRKHMCQVLGINDLKVTYNANILLNDNNILIMELIDINEKDAKAIIGKDILNLKIKIDNCIGTLITETQLKVTSSRKNPQDLHMSISYVVSCLLLGIYCDNSTKKLFDGFSFEFTDEIELLGIYPYEIKEKNSLLDVDMNIRGYHLQQVMGSGFSYFVAPKIKKNEGMIHLSAYGKIQYCGVGKTIKDINKLIDKIIILLEVLSGELVTPQNICITSQEESWLYLGAYNYKKEKLTCLSNGFDTRSYLRQSLFKLSDFRQGDVNIIESVDKLLAENQLAFEAYEQVLLDNDTQIVTYNKFLKIMQIIEGFQRAKINESESEDFKKQKNKILEKIEDENDKAFIEKYTSYNGETFRKCLKEFTCAGLKLISGLAKTRICSLAEELFGKIINDRDVYTHASKEKRPVLTYEEVDQINYCYLVFFRILVLNNLGMGENVLRSRLAFDRTFKSYYKTLFGQEIEVSNQDDSVFQFDFAMWGLE